MRIFITGGTGYIGTVIVKELLSSGHDLTALVRTPSKLASLRELGATPHSGDLTRPESYRAAAAEHDAIIHAAYDYENPARVDKTAIDTLLQAAKTLEQERLFIYTSGTHVLGDTRENPADEEAATDHPAPNVVWRSAHERLVLDAANARLATAVIRPGMVYGGSGGLTARLFKSARTTGPAVVIGDGENFWSMVHVADLAVLYRFVVEQRARGICHGVDGRPIKAKDVARRASEAALGGGSTVSMPLDEAREKLGALADALCLNQIVVGRNSLDLGWRPKHDSFVSGVEIAFDEWQASSKEEPQVS